MGGLHQNVSYEWRSGLREWRADLQFVRLISVGLSVHFVTFWKSDDETNKAIEYKNSKKMQYSHHV